MLPTKTPQTLRVIQAFDLITPDGQIHRFPRPTWLQRAFIWLHAYAEPAIVSAVILGLIYTAGVLAEPLEALARDACADQNSSPPSILLWSPRFAS
jgi:hypothetical protein